MLLLGTLLLALQDSSSPKLQKTPPDAKIEHLDSISGPICFTKDGAMAAVLLADTSAVILIDFSSKKIVRTLTGLRQINRKGRIIPSVTPVLAFSPDSRFLLGGLITSSDKGGGPQVIWDVRSGKALGSFRVCEGDIESLAFTADGKTFVSAGHDGPAGPSKDAVKVWPWDSDHPAVPVAPLRSLEVRIGFGGITLGPEDKTILCKCSEGGYEIHDVETGALLQTINTLAPERPAWSGSYCTRYSPDAKLLAIASDTRRNAKRPAEDPEGLVRLWNVEDNTLRREFPSARTSLTVSFTPDSKRVVVTAKLTESGDQCRTCLYEVESGACLRRMEGEFTDAVVTPDGHWIVAAGKNEILLWKMPP